MSLTPDSAPGQREEESILLDDAGVDPTVTGVLQRNGDALMFKKSTGAVDITQVGTDNKDLKVSATDTTAAFLFSKLIAANPSITLTKNNPGANETISIAANVSNIFSVTTLDAIALLSTTSSLPQDAFSGSSLSVVTAGDYLAFFEAEGRITNNNGIMAISVGLNGLNEVANSVHQYSGVNLGTTITIQRLNGLTPGNTVHGLFRKQASPGTVEIRSRTLVLMRIA